MSYNPHAFCRILLSQIMPDVKKHFTKEQIASAWVWDSAGGRKHFEFHGPAGEYFHDLKFADCISSAKAEGWNHMLRVKGVEGYCDAENIGGAL